MTWDDDDDDLNDCDEGVCIRHIPRDCKNCKITVSVDDEPRDGNQRPGTGQTMNGHCNSVTVLLSHNLSDRFSVHSQTG